MSALAHPTAPDAAPIVDTHLHVASPDRTAYPRHHGQLATTRWWEAPGVDGDALVGTLASAGVHQGIVVQAVGLYGFDNRYLVDVVRAHQERLRAVVAVDVGDPGFLGAIASAGQTPAVVGARLFALRSARSWVGAPQAAQAVRACGKAGLTVVLTALGTQLDALRPALASCPDTAVVVDHCGFPTLRSGRIVADDPMWSLAELTNVSLKVTTHLLASAGPEHHPAMVMGQLVQRFGAQRVLWGSDHPQSALRSYGDHLRLAHRAVARLVPEEQAAVLGANAARLFSLDRRAAPD